MPEQHACALSLSAVLLSRPYVIEEWTGSVLMALARAARAPAPVKVSATEALGNVPEDARGDVEAAAARAIGADGVGCGEGCCCAVVVLCLMGCPQLGCRF